VGETEWDGKGEANESVVGTVIEESGRIGKALGGYVCIGDECAVQASIV